MPSTKILATLGPKAQEFEKMFADYRDFPVTEKVSASTIALPFHNNLTKEEISYICGVLENVVS